MRKKKNPPMKFESVEWFDDHFYKVRGKDGFDRYLPSTTTILQVSPKPGLTKWRGDIGNREADLRMIEAQDRGSRVHHACYAIAQGGAVAYVAPWNKRETLANDAVEKLRTQYQAGFVILSSQHEAVMAWRFQRWLQTVKPLILSSELTVANLEVGYAGTVDHILQIQAGIYDVNGSKPLEIKESGLYIVDLKTGGEYDEHELQLASYDKGYGETYDEQVKGAIIIYLDAATKKGIEGVKTTVLTRPELDAKFEIFKNVLQIWRWKNPSISPDIFSFPSVIEAYHFPKKMQRKKKVRK